MSELKEKIGLELFNHIEGQVEFGDTKAALLVAADAILIGAYLSVVGEFGLTQRISRISVAIIILASLIIMIAYSLSLWTIIPNPKHGKINSLLLYSYIATFDNPEDFVREFLDVEEDELRNEILRDVYGKSKWAHRKFTLLRWAVLLTGTSVVLVIIALLLETLLLLISM